MTSHVSGDFNVLSGNVSHNGSVMSKTDVDKLHAITVTAAAINAAASNPATETITAAGACSVTVPVSIITIAAGGAITLAAPTVAGLSKVIVSTNTQSVTLALTNCTGGTAATTATFAHAGDSLSLISTLASSGKWLITGQGVSVVLS